ncbi:MAG: hypothetical protein LLG37_00955 [Spirochaetia bacterium]|nr:hypothetical protein [Spirochaetia bacterium]
MAKDEMSINKNNPEDMISIGLPEVEKKEPPEMETEALPGFMQLSTVEMADAKPVQQPVIKNTAPAMPELVYDDFLNENTITAIISLNEEMRKVLAAELASRGVAQRILDNMMLKTLEKSALSSRILRNTNWDSEGNLRADGSMDVERFFKNLTGGDIMGDMDTAIADGLSCLMLARLKAVKAGLGSDKYGSVKSALKNKFMVISAGFGSAVSSYYGEKVLDAAIRMGDENK